MGRWVFCLWGELESHPVGDGRREVAYGNLSFSLKGITIMIDGGDIRNHVTRGDLDRLGNLRKCEKISLSGETQIADGFSTEAVYGSF